MADLSAPVLSDIPNSGIVHMPGRRFPGVVLQGDSLSSVFDGLVGALNSAKTQRDDEAYYSIFIALDKFQKLLLAYEEALRSTGSELPYPVSISERLVYDTFAA